MRHAAPRLVVVLVALLLASCDPRPHILSPADRSVADASGEVPVSIDLVTPLPPGGKLRLQLLVGVDPQPTDGLPHPALRELDLSRFTLSGTSLTGSLHAADLLVGRSWLFVSVDRNGHGLGGPADSASFSWEPGIDLGTADRCDFLDTGRCLFPFPNDQFTVADPATDTGRRIHLARDSMPANWLGVHVDPSEWNRGDGFSPGPVMVTLVPQLDLAQTGAAPITDMQQAVDDPDSPIVLIDTATRQRIPLWAERDVQAPSPETSALEIRPGVNLADGRRYIVALRRLRDASGALIPPGHAFRLFRDRIPTYVPAVETRRRHFEQLFIELDAAGVRRDDLFLAWDFTVRSKRDVSERLIHMRDDAFATLGGAAPSFSVSSVEENPTPELLRRVKGTFQVPLYLTGTGEPGSRLVLGADGLPVRQAGSFTAPFQCNIPRAVLDADGVTVHPARAGIYGHGLLGSQSEIDQDQLQTLSNDHDYLFCATKWAGMSSDDQMNVIQTITDLSAFPSVSDRLHEGFLAFLFLGRLMIHPDGFVSDAAFQAGPSSLPVIDRSDLFYDGNSQGAIAGGGVSAIAQDWTRAVLGVAGMNYSTLLRRSADFDLFLAILKTTYTEPLDVPLGIALIQLPWDRVETNGHANHLTADPYPGTPPKKILLHVAFGDHQVANVTVEVEARTIGARIHQPALAAGRHSDVHPYWGIDPLPDGPWDGSAMIVWDSGTPTPPTVELPPEPPTYGNDPHETPRRQPAAQCQKSKFLRTGGVVVNVCGSAPCLAVDPPGPYPPFDCPAD